MAIGGGGVLLVHSTVEYIPLIEKLESNGKTYQPHKRGSLRIPENLHTRSSLDTRSPPDTFNGLGGRGGG